ncbi:MAG: methyl-accepting chemotaxis protein [Treponema sp.]|nr:methyl-accepting chemotaxis protein [Treponema sp.]
MKIRAKLFSGFLVVMAIGILLGAVGLFGNNRLVSYSEEILGIAETSSHVSAILNSHYVWRHGLSETVYAGTPFTGSLDSNACLLGAWLSSDEVRGMTDSEILTILGQIIEPHHFIHNRAREIIADLDAGQIDQAVVVFREEVLPNTLTVINGLQAIQARYGEILNETIVEIYNTGIMFQTIIIAFIVVAVIASILLVLIITSSIAKPIVKVADLIKVVAEGDLTSSVTVNTKDEVGDLARDLNFTLEKIKTLVLGIRNESDTLSDIGSTLAKDMTQTAASINEIANNIKGIKARVINQSASVTQTDATMGQIAENINKLSGHVERQAESVAQSSSAIEQMLANIQSVTRTLIKNSENVHELTGASDVGRNGLQDVVADIQEIARESEGLLEINSVMSNISSQTNLLSMNAAIEAAHAGESGKGFAVVADEIRKLAESSSVQSKTISAVLKKIKTSIDKITSSTNNVLLKFEAIDTGVKTVAEQEENIRNAMEEQDQGSKQILEAISNVNDITQLVKNEVREMLEGAREVIKEANNLKNVTEEITGGMNEMAIGADQINTAVQNVNGLSTRNQESTGHLITEVSKFKVT